MQQTSLTTNRSNRFTSNSNISTKVNIYICIDYLKFRIEMREYEYNFYTHTQRQSHETSLSYTIITIFIF
jgi:hypothetical protein